MDIYLRCNILTCRIELKEHGVVTTCSHIFCPPCTQSEPLLNPLPGHIRQCPACKTMLQNPDDLVKTQLYPTEDYKSSVLSGMDPNTIADCAGRGLNFWQYQVTQEVFYQLHVAKSMTDKLGNVNAEMDKIIDQANTEIGNLQNKLAAMEIEQESLVNKNHELVDKIKETGNRFKTQKQLYDKLKAQTLQHGLQTAASHNADLAALSITDSRTFTAGTGASFNQQYPQHAQPNASTRTRQYPQQVLEQHQQGQRSHGRSHSGSTADHEGMPPPGRPLPNPRIQSLQSGNQSGTPQHRERLGMPSSHRVAQRTSIPQPTQGFLAGPIVPQSATRQRIGVNSGRLAAMSSGNYGLSAAAKTGRASNTTGNHFETRFGNDFGQGNARSGNQGHFDAANFGGAYH